MKALSLLAILMTLTTNAYAMCSSLSFQLERESGFSSRCAQVLPEGEYHALVCSPGQPMTMTDPNGKQRTLSLNENKYMSVKAQKEVFSVDTRVTRVEVLSFTSPGSAIVCKGYFYR